MTNSPVQNFLRDYIKVDKTLNISVYIQISEQIIKAIQQGILNSESALPGTRVFSKIIGIHRNTAVAVYDELASQGWVKIMPNKGTFIMDSSKKRVKSKSLETKSDKAEYYFQKSLHLSSTIEKHDAKYFITDGQPDYRLQAVNEFSKRVTTTLKGKKITNNNLNQNNYFIAQLCNYLNATRGFYLQQSNILSTKNYQLSLYIVTKILIQKNDLVLVGNLSNHEANTVFHSVGAKIKTVPIDSEGLDINYIKNHFSKDKIRCIYLNVTNDYPTTVSLSNERRKQLLELAREYNFVLIENEDNFDFQYENKKVFPLLNEENRNKIIYLGTIGKCLLPNFQNGFIIASEDFIKEAKNYLEMLDKEGDFLQEQVVSNLIFEGELHRLYKKQNLIYKERRDLLAADLKKQFKDKIYFEIPSSGLAFWLQFTSKISLIEFKKAAIKYDLFLPKTILFQNKTTCAIRFGFAHLNEDEIDIVVSKLKNAYDEVCLNHH